MIKVVLLEMLRLKDCYILGHKVSKGTEKGSDLGLEKERRKVKILCFLRAVNKIIVPKKKRDNNT